MDTRAQRPAPTASVRRRAGLHFAFAASVRFAFAAGVLVALGAGGTAPAWAQGVQQRTGPVFAEPLRAGDGLPAARPSGTAFARGSGGGAPSATITVAYDVSFPPEARAAFQAAVDSWARFIRSDVPIRISAHWRSFDNPNILGAAGPFLVMDFQGAPAPRTWYAYALADALAGRDLFPGEPDIQADFNSAFGQWHFDPTTPPPAGSRDLATVVLHELGHGLGFIGSLDVENGVGVVGAEDDDGTEDGVPFVYDRFTEDADGDPLLAYPDRSAALAAALRSATFFDGPAVRAAHGDRAPLYAPVVWLAGSSYSHLDESAFPTGTANALMTPFIASGERVVEPDTLACAVLIDIGWAPGPGCAALVPEVPTPIPTPGFTLTLAPGAPNPFRGGTAVRLTVERSQRVLVGLYDGAGRRVAVLFDRVLPGGGEARVAVPEGLPAGVYAVRADGDAFTGALLLTRAR